MTDQPPTEQQLDEIETRAAHLHEYALLDDEPMQADADQLTGKDVPALAAEVRRLRPALTEMTHCRDNALAALYRDDVETDIDLEETIAAPFYGPGWDWDESDLKPVVREAADAVRPAFGKLTEERDRLRTELAASRATVLAEVAEELEGINFHPDAKDFCANLCRMLAGRFRRKAADVVAPDTASAPPAAPLSAVQGPSVSESAQSPTGAPEGALRATGAPGDFRSETEISARGWTA